MAVLDTTALIDAERGLPAALQAIRKAQAAGEAVRIAAASWIEYLSPLSEGRRLDAIGRLLASASFEPMTRELSEAAAALQHTLLQRGEGLAWHDLQVAATALHYREPLLTRGRDFARVEGLLLQSY